MSAMSIMQKSVFMVCGTQKKPACMKAGIGFDVSGGEEKSKT